MGNLFRGLIRISAFVRKEIFEILRQPRLILSLVLGPFLILLLFGIGYQNKPRELRTMFVVEEGSALEQQINEYATSLGEQLIFVGTTDDEEFARQELRRGRIDLVAVTPDDAYGTIRNNEQATFLLYHNEIDPLQADYIRYFGKIYIDEVNRRVLRTITDRSQGEAVTVNQNLSAARSSASELRAALEQGDGTAARQHQRELDQNLDEVEGSVGNSIDVLDGVQQTIGTGNTDAEASGLRASLSRIRDSTTSLGEIEEGQESYDEEATRAAQIETELETLDSQLGDFNQVDSRVLVSPFTSETEAIARIQPQLAHYFAPSVIVLLLQHLAITFAALSIVREAQLGSLELFRVSPISAGETLVGKYLSYLIFGGVLALILTGLLVTNIPIPGLEGLLNSAQPPAIGLGVPMLGSWAYYALVIAALLFAAIGVGFVISLIVDTDSQAVQYAMIVLLTSVFFSGFFLSLQSLWEPVRVVSWSLPATYAILLLQDIMLRGTTGKAIYLIGLAAIGTLLYAVAWFLLQRRMRRS